MSDIKNKTNFKVEMQEEQYSFPYHYIPSFGHNETPLLHRVLDWGFEYLTYISFIHDKVKTLKPNSILDIGCGDGYFLNNLGLMDVEKYGVDLSKRAILFSNAFSTGAKFEVKDVFSLKAQYSLVSLIEVLEHIPDDNIEAFLQKIYDLVADNGHFIISVPSSNEPVHRKHFRHYNDELLTKQIEQNAEFKLIEEHYIYSNLKSLKLITKLFHNRIYTLNLSPIKRLFWKLHKRFYYYSDKKHGSHIIRIYKKVNNG